MPNYLLPHILLSILRSLHSRGYRGMVREGCLVISVVPLAMHLLFLGKAAGEDDRIPKEWGCGTGTLEPPKL